MTSLRGVIDAHTRFFLDSNLLHQTATTTTLPLRITSELFELESWGCAQIEALFK